VIVIEIVDDNIDKERQGNALTCPLQVFEHTLLSDSIKDQQQLGTFILEASIPFHYFANE
jgi:hypothetical protein